MKNTAEYMQFVVSRKAIVDQADFDRLLRVSLLTGISGVDKKLASTMRFQYSAEADFLFAEAFVGTQALLTYQRTAKKRPFFLKMLHRITRFMSFYSTDVGIVFFSDEHSRMQSLQEPISRPLEYLDTSTMNPGLAVVLDWQSDFYFCLYNAKVVENTGDLQNQATEFYAHSVVLASGPEEVDALVYQHLENAGAALLRVEEIERVAPLEVIPDLDVQRFEWQPHRVIYSSGRAFYDDQLEDPSEEKSSLNVPECSE
jgi:hypothetical protein